MPKERIKDSGYKMFDIVVGWDKESELVQLAVVDTDDLERIRVGTNDEVFTGLYCTLQPDTIDALIKALRKAKRQAFPVN